MDGVPRLVPPSAGLHSRMLATLLFTDLVASTATLARLGDSAWREVLSAHYEAARAELERFRGREVETTGEVDSATERLSTLGLFTQVEDDTTCCYARQDKVWVHGPGHEPWEVYTVKEDSQEFGTNGPVESMADSGSDVCCGVNSCCTTDETPAQDGTTLVEAKTAAGCGCLETNA